MENMLLKYNCESCDYHTNKKSSYNNHTLSIKHNRRINGDMHIMLLSGTPFICSKCNAQYKSQSGLWKHKPKCNVTNTLVTEKDILLMLVKQNSDLIKDNTDFKELILTIVKNGTMQNSNHNTIQTNSHNKSFNLQFFLNETCKDAMNITDFVDSIKLQMSDLMDVGKSGYVDGISNIINKNLNALDETVRPVHCTDQKREIFYIKDDGVWEKDDDEKKRMQKIVRRISYKNELMLNQYKLEHPGCNFSESSYADQYSRLFLEVMSGDKDKHDKIIKNLRKTTIIKENK